MNLLMYIGERIERRNWMQSYTAASYGLNWTQLSEAVSYDLRRRFVRRNWTRNLVRRESYDLKRRSNFKSLNSRGQIGQILTSFPSLIFVFVIMLIFVVISGFLAKDLQAPDSRIPESNPDAKAFLSLFIEQKVSGSSVGIGLPDGDISVGVLLKLVSSLSGSQQQKLIDYLQKLFHETYSCNERNLLKLVRFSSDYERKLIFIDYPLTFRTLPLLREQSASQREYINLCQNHLLNPNGVSADIVLQSKDYKLCVYVEVNVLC